MKDIIRGAYDLHFHTSPDIKSRKLNDYQLVKRLEEKGMKGVAIKSHFFETASRACLMNYLFPNMEVYGGVTLNNSVGGLNPTIVEKVAQIGGKFVWFPTMDALSYHKFKGNKIDRNLITILDSKNQLIPEVEAVLKNIKKYNMILGTGHLSSKEGLILIKKASEMGIQKMIVTHSDNPANYYSINDQIKAAEMGAIIEHSYLNVFWKQTNPVDLVDQIKKVGVDKVLLSTDFGQVESPNSDEGILQFSKLLMINGISEKDIRKMIVDNPKKLLF